MLTRTVTQLDYLLRETLTGLYRAGWMNWSAVSVLTTLLYVFGLGWQGVWQMDQGLTALGSQLEVSVYLKPSSRGADLKNEVRQLSGVTGVDLVTREESLTRLQKEVGIQKDFARVLGSNPLVDVLHLKIQTPEAVKPVAEVVRVWPQVEAVHYGSEAAERLGQIKRVVSWAGLALLGLLAIATVAVVMTTIGLVVAARQREIEVMQLVGANPTWIYLPFVLEGLVLGVLGAAAAWSLITITGNFIQQQLQSYLPFLSLSDAAPTPWHLPVILAASGIVLGSLGSFLAVVRYAKH
ncbi:cell division protein FtsX [Anthocerotibacter panamensis]|uniref:cell division protein FtsX n=1 Tax=Anthocerotibacter panamensis TaxID=2857077 RepID=UPI001C405070|nr:ABC transporter permease [Anthocerotibacter panamensis]